MSLTGSKPKRRGMFSVTSFFYRGEYLVVEAALVFFVGQAVRCDLRLDEVEVGERAVLGLERQLAAVDAVGVGDYAARAALAEYFFEHDDGAYAGVDDVLEHVAGRDGGKLVHVADEYQRRAARHGLEKMVEEYLVYHRGFVDDEQVAFELVFFVAHEAAAE